MEEDLLDDAEPLFDEVLQGYTSLLGRTHKDTIETLLQIASLYSKKNQLSQAESEFKDLIATCSKHFGLFHPSTFEAFQGLIDVYSKEERLEDIEVVLSRLLNQYKPDHTTAKRVYAAFLLGQICFKNDKFDQAESLFRHAVEGSRMQDMSITLTESLRALGSTLHELGSWGEARPFLVQALDGYTRTADSYNCSCINILNMLRNHSGGVEESENWRSLLDKLGLMLQWEMAQEGRDVNGIFSLAVINSRMARYPAASELFDQIYSDLDAALEMNQVLGVHGFAEMALHNISIGRWQEARTQYARAKTAHNERARRGEETFPAVDRKLEMVCEKLGQVDESGNEPGWWE